MYKYGRSSKNLIKSNSKIDALMSKIDVLKQHIDNVSIESTNKKTNRYLIENYFCRIKQMPKLYLRTDKKVTTFLSTVYIGILYNYLVHF